MADDPENHLPWGYQPDDHDWTEDFAHENGTYGNTCCMCNSLFVGHKRRVVCRKCATSKRKDGV